jgi:nucleoside-diphosphate kinase
MAGKPLCAYLQSPQGDRKAILIRERINSEILLSGGAACRNILIAQREDKLPMQRTLILLKPDAVQRRLVGEIISRFERKGLRLVGLKMVQAHRELAEQHYAVHRGKPFYDSLLAFLTSGPTVAMVWEGREAVSVARMLMGLTDGARSAPGTIRGDFGLSVQNNLIHGSDSPENAEAEIALWFRPDELVQYTPTDASWIG